MCQSVGHCMFSSFGPYVKQSGVICPAGRGPFLGGHWWDRSFRSMEPYAVQMCTVLDEIAMLRGGTAPVGRADASDRVSATLQDLGMGQYINEFRAQRIDDEALGLLQGTRSAVTNPHSALGFRSRQIFQSRQH